MQSLTAILFILANLVGPNTRDNKAYVGSLSGVEVTAARYAAQDTAWRGLIWMPAVEVVAPRFQGRSHTGRSTMPVTEVAVQEYTKDHKDMQQNDKPRILQALYVQDEKDIDAQTDLKVAELEVFSAIPSAMTFSGDYQLAEGDTIDEDVTVTGGNAQINGVISGDLAVMGGTVDVTGSVSGDVVVLGGNLDLSGLIDGDAAVFGGNIKNRGNINGDLNVIGGTVYLDSGSVVTGDISMVGGTVERNEYSQVLGKVESVEIKALEKVLPRISRAFRLPQMIPGSHVFPRAMFIGMLVVLFLLNMLVLLIFPNATINIAEKIQQNVWASFGLGIAIQILFVPLIVLFAVSIIGIPLIILLPLALFLATLFGTTALSLVVGERVIHGFKWQIENQVGKFSLGWLAIMLIPIVVSLIGPPLFVIGLVIVYIATTIGVGGVIYTLIKRRKTAAPKK
jgi:hypothetical protein